MKSGRAWMETSHEGRREVDLMTTNMNWKCMHAEYVETVGVHATSQLYVIAISAT